MLTWLLLATAAAQPQPPPAGDAVYFVMVDRFADGTPDAPGSTDPSDPQGWHGGDLKGLMDKLPYIEDLGFRSIWITPPFESRDAAFHEWGAYHGYWVDDLGSIDPRFGTVEELKALTDDLHSRDMRLVLDIVYNHTGFDSPLLAQRPEWFHDTPTISDWSDPIQAVTYQVHGLPDLAQEREEVATYLFDTTNMWLSEVGVDGLRIDAVRHLPSEFLRDLGERFDGVQRLGEIFEGRRSLLVESWRETALTSVFDYPLHYAMNDVFCDDQAPGRLAAVISAEAVDPAPGRWFTFLDNHDVPRVASRCGGDLERVRQALRFQFLSRGTPTLTYGTESGLLGEHEPANRGDMNFESTPLAAEVKALLQLRRDHPVLSDGSMAVHQLDDSFVVFERVLGAQRAWVVVNRADQPQKVRLPQGAEELTAPMGDTLKGRTLTVAAGTTTVVLGAGQVEASAASRTVEFKVAGLEGKARLVGAEAPLGDWSVENGVPLQDGRGSLEVPVGWVMEYKVVQWRDGQWIWESGDNHHVLVEEGRGPQQVRLNWRQTKDGNDG